MTAVRADLAAMLRAGALHRDIRDRLRVSNETIAAARQALGIELPPGRFKRTRAQIKAVEPRAVAMLRAGATYDQVRAETGLSLNAISTLRKQHNITVRGRRKAPTKRLTVDQAFALHTRPTATGDHLLWTGPRSGRSVDLTASGQTRNARSIAFQRHHGREPEGRMWRTCEHPDCIAGAHHTDRRIRGANARADHMFESIFGPGDTP